MEPFAAAQLAPPLFQQTDLGSGVLPPGVPTQQAIHVDPALQIQFESVLEGTQPIAMPTLDGASAVASSDKATIGEAILDSLGALKEAEVSLHQEIAETLGKEQLDAGDMLHIQYRIMTVNLELQTTSNMAHHGVEDVKTVMRGQ